MENDILSSGVRSMLLESNDFPSYSGAPETHISGLANEYEQPIDSNTRSFARNDETNFEIGGRHGPALQMGYTEYGMYAPEEFWLDGNMARLSPQRIKPFPRVGPTGGTDPNANLHHRLDYPAYSQSDIEQALLKVV